jgi:uncharacterized membrane protein
MNRESTRNTGPSKRDRRRKGAFQVLALSSLIAGLGLTAMSIDLAMVSLAKTRLQNAVDAAALAASQEITAAVAAAGDAAGSSGSAGGAVTDANSIAVSAAKAMAVKVAGLNGVSIPNATSFSASASTTTEPIRSSGGSAPTTSSRSRPARTIPSRAIPTRRWTSSSPASPARKRP